MVHPDSGTRGLDYGRLSFCGGVFERARYEQLEAGKLKANDVIVPELTDDDVQQNTPPALLFLEVRRLKKGRHFPKRRLSSGDASSKRRPFEQRHSWKRMTGFLRHHVGPSEAKRLRPRMQFLAQAPAAPIAPTAPAAPAGSAPPPPADPALANAVPKTATSPVE